MINAKQFEHIGFLKNYLSAITLCPSSTEDRLTLTRNGLVREVSHLGVFWLAISAYAFTILRKSKSKSKSRPVDARVLHAVSGKFRAIVVSTKVLCPICRGDGRKADKDCPACAGTGEISNS